MPVLTVETGTTFFSIPAGSSCKYFCTTGSTVVGGAVVVGGGSSFKPQSLKKHVLVTSTFNNNIILQELYFLFVFMDKQLAMYSTVEVFVLVYKYQQYSLFLRERASIEWCI